MLTDPPQPGHGTLCRVYLSQFSYPWLGTHDTCREQLYPAIFGSCTCGSRFACVSNPLLHFISKGVLDAADMEPEVQEEAQEWEQPQGFSPEYVRELLTSCIQAAVALVDKRGNKHDARATRATRRIMVMLTLMTGKCVFFFYVFF